MIYTSYYAKLKKIPKDIEPISISRYKPKGVSIFSYPSFRPSDELLSWWKNCKQTEEDKKKYIDEFSEKLNSLDIEKVKNDLNKLSCGRDVVLLCYEKSEDFCHRQLVAEWLRSKGEPCEEWSE